MFSGTVTRARSLTADSPQGKALTFLGTQEIFSSPTGDGWANVEDQSGYDAKSPPQLELNQVRGLGQGNFVRLLTYGSSTSNLWHGAIDTDEWCTNETNTCYIARHGHLELLDIKDGSSGHTTHAGAPGTDFKPFPDH